VLPRVLQGITARLPGKQRTYNATWRSQQFRHNRIFLKACPITKIMFNRKSTWRSGASRRAYELAQVVDKLDQLGLARRGEAASRPAVHAPVFFYHPLRADIIAGHAAP
jgi:hypothetical protein